VELYDRFVAIIYLRSLDSDPKQPSIIPCQMSGENWIRARFFRYMVTLICSPNYQKY